MKNKIFKELVQVVSNNKKIIFIVLSIIVILLIIIFGIILFLNINYINKYKNYEDKMITYGFDKLYNNEKANTTNFVKNSEAIKVIICASYNISNLQKFNIYSDEDKYLNSSYIEYAKICKILNDEINDKNYNIKSKEIYFIKRFKY
ncbi:MAG: hypothetical protein RSF67_09080 [Clostridia bacterium]